MKLSSIGWCDYSGGAANILLRGSTPGDCECSRGCAACYVLRLPFAKRWLPERTTCYPDKLAKLARMRVPEFSPKRGAPHKPMVFLADCGDLFHPDVPEPFIMRAFDMMAWRDDLIWQVLTKRPERMRDMARLWTGNIGTLPENIWLGVSVEDQAAADERIPILLETPAAVRFVSIEPMLERVNIDKWLWRCECGKRLGPPFGKWRWNGETWEHHHGYPIGHVPVEPSRELHWCLVGAESGPDRRPFDAAWARDIYDQCRAAGVPCFLKQDSDLRPGKPLLIDGREVHEWPMTN